MLFQLACFVEKTQQDEQFLFQQETVTKVKIIKSASILKKHTLSCEYLSQHAVLVAVFSPCMSFCTPRLHPNASPLALQLICSAVRLITARKAQAVSDSVIKGTKEILVLSKLPPIVSQQGSHVCSRLLDITTGSTTGYGKRAAGRRDQEDALKTHRGHVSFYLASNTCTLRDASCFS